MISREAAFAEGLQRIRRIAREQGNCISEEQVKEEFADLEFNDTQLQMVYDYLEKHKIGMGEPADPDAGLTEEVRGVRLDDLSYLQMDYTDRFTVRIAYGADYAWELQRLIKSLEKDVIQSNMTGVFDLQLDTERVYFIPDLR